MAVLTREIEIVSPGLANVFCFVFGLITHVPRRLKSSEEAVAASWVNSRCLDPSMKDFLFCFPEAYKEV